MSGPKYQSTLKMPGQNLQGHAKKHAGQIFMSNLSSKGSVAIADNDEEEALARYFHYSDGHIDLVLTSSAVLSKHSLPRCARQRVSGRERGRRTQSKSIPAARCVRCVTSYCFPLCPLTGVTGDRRRQRGRGCSPQPGICQTMPENH